MTDMTEQKMATTTEHHEERVLGAALDAPGLWLAQSARIYPELFGTHRDVATELCAMTA